MKLPKYHETFIPILETLSNGKPLHYKDLKIAVRDKYYSDLPDELLDKQTKSGEQLILNRIGWGKAYLKTGKLIFQPERAMVQITEKGLNALKKGSYSLKDLMDDPDYLNHVAERDRKKDSDEVSDANASPEDLIDSGIESMESNVISELVEQLKTVDPYYFETIVLTLLKRMGYGDFLETAKSGDGGIDGIINQDQLGIEKIYVQSKRYSENKVRETDIRNFIGAMSGDTSKGIFVTTSSFDDKAIVKANDAMHSIILIDGQRLARLMYKYNVGVQVKDVYEVKQLDQDFFDQV